MLRREFLQATAAIASGMVIDLRSALSAEPPTNNPTALNKISWTEKIRWGQTVDIVTCPGKTVHEKLEVAQALLSKKGGGVVYFPAGVYTFTLGIEIKNGIILRGADPQGSTHAKDETYTLGTRFEFPEYKPTFEGNGTAISSAFFGIRCEKPATDSLIGVVNVAINRGHIHFADDGTELHHAGSARLVYGCILRNAAVADPSVPNLKIGQKGWQRFTSRHHAAIDIKAERDLLVANNRLPQSGEENFTMMGYVLHDQKKKEIPIDGVVFDYDNRPGMYINHYALGGAGGMGPDGTPESHPFAFRRGIVILNNFIFNTGRMGIGFAGDGVRCEGNVIRFPDNIWRPTATGQVLTGGSSTNDNRAIEMRGWRWQVVNNEYTVHRNWAFDKKYKINDGEGLMHEDHVNSTVKDAVLKGNKGNTYLSIYKTAGIDGLLIEGNDIRLGDGKQSIASGAAIFASADRTKDRFPCKNVTITKNVVAGGGILISGDPAENNVISGNRCVGPAGKLTNNAQAKLDGNENFEGK